MDILIIILLSVAAYFLVKKISEKTGIANAIAYIIIGTLIGILIRNMGYGTINEVLPHIDKYTNLLLLLMFFSAGFSINVAAIAKSGKTIPKLSFIPSIVETLVIGPLMYFLVKHFGAAINIHLNIYETILIAGILALSSTANVVPYCIELIQGKYKTKNDIQNTMVAVSITDGFSTFPLIILALFLAIEKSKGIPFTAITVIKITVGVILGLVICAVLGYFLGKLINMLMKPLMESLIKDKDNKIKTIVTTAAIFLMSYVIILLLSELPTVGTIISSLGILLMCLIGAGISHYDETGGSKLVSVMGNKAFAILGTPIVFVSVGTKLNLKTLFDPNMLIIGVITCCVAILVKGTVGALLLNKETYTDEERKFVFSCFVPKGLALVNFSVLFAGLAIEFDAINVINFMVMLAGITIIISTPIGVTLLAKSKDRWFTK